MEQVIIRFFDDNYEVLPKYQGRLDSSLQRHAAADPATGEVNEIPELTPSDVQRFLNLAPQNQQTDHVYKALTSVMLTAVSEESTYDILVLKKQQLKRYAPGGLEEQIIGKSSQASIQYVFHLKDLFPPGEAAIAKNSTSSLTYATKFIKGPFPAGEKVLSMPDDVVGMSNAMNYAEHIKGRFIPAEKNIYYFGDDWLIKKYEKIVIDNNKANRDFIDVRNQYMQVRNLIWQNDEILNLFKQTVL